ncbi:MAG TPA: hypothetical protein ENK97_02805 [Campylobacteraceae bacterium]|nr:hypothetical protein [Campylobacteraceae bacterium]
MRTRQYVILTLLLVWALPLFASANSHCCKEELLEALSENPEIVNVEELGALYHQKRYTILWNRTDLDALLALSEDPKYNYLQLPLHTAPLRQMRARMALEPLDPASRAKLDLLASDQFISFAKFLYEGEIDAKRFFEIVQEYGEKGLVWEPNPRKPHYLSDLKKALRTHRIQSILTRYPPAEKAFRALVEAYHRYRTMRFPKIDYLKDLKRGDYGYEVAQLKHYLHVTGDLAESDPKYLDFPTFDEKLEQAVLRFQKRHYLKQNGIFDRVNVLYARRSAQDKAALIHLNIERYKLFPRIVNDTHVIINIPGFILQFFEDGTLMDEIPVVIGREDRPTPIFRDVLEYIVLNPSWSIPQNLMKKDYIPHLAEDPASLLRDDIHIYRGGKEIDPEKVDWSKYLNYEGRIPYRMVQKAGEKNVLGAMKFIFPNRYHVYLHDTNAKKLTTLRYRLYSSGCIRLAEPYKLLALLSPYTRYSYDRLLDIIASGKTAHIRLKRKVPIHIRYLTAFVDGAGRINFRKDFYGYDAIQMPLLNRSSMR